MFNRASGIPLLIASVGCIAYQMIQQHRENLEAERQAKISNERFDAVAEEVKASLTAESIPFNGVDIWGEALKSARESAAGQNN